MPAAKAPVPHKLVIALTLAATFLFTFSQFLLITAYPTIMEEFDVNATQVQWLTTSFLLATMVFIPMSGYLISRFTSRQLVLFSLVTLTAGTLIGAAAPTFSVLILSRIVQAIGAGIMLPLVQTILLNIFPCARRGFAMGLLGAVVNVAPASAPSLSGMIIDVTGWRPLHLVMLIPAAVVLVAAWYGMKNVTEQKPTRLDLPSVFLSGFGFSLLILALSTISVTGFSSWMFWGPLMSGAALTIVYVRRQLVLETPLLNLRLFRFPVFRLAMLLVFINMMLLLSAESILPMFSQDVLGTSAFLSGFLLVPGTILLSVMTIVSGNLYDKYGGRILAVAGFFFLFLSTALMATVQMDSSPYLIMLYFCIFMLGCGLTLMTLVTTSVNSLEQEDIPHGAAINNTLRQFGMAFGVIVLTTVISVTTAQSSAPYEEAVYTGTIYVFWIMAILALTATFLSLRLRESPR
ncbi:DHA2 family efflux MFS transporter permease subunit [Alkalicoccus luteus]|uniref:Multidrug efflux MFS transporter n=1 Tax=Alkalicoccus luteus TaxID=1237094 RepID=A0A969PNW5_9BACI|nr:DHA2 family efflux MFS transporter permease subunit [Alkalicoccus luteus]NJP36254.1 multidrug efflux MFS transporter [Alkalicoccus luteus]